MAGRGLRAAAGVSPVDVYDYLMRARRKILSRVGRLTLAQYATTFPFGRGSMRETLVHVVDTEWWYTRLLRGEPGEAEPFRPLRETPFPPLAAAWAKQATETRATLRAEEDWGRAVESRWRGRIKVRGIRTTAGGIATQLLLHEVHHRAQVMAMLRRLGKPVQSVDYSLLCWGWFEERVGEESRETRRTRA